MIIDFSYGLLIIGSLILSQLLKVSGNTLVAFAIGIAIGYTIYVINRMITFNQMISEAAEEAVAEEAEERVEERIEEEVERVTNEE